MSTNSARLGMFEVEANAPIVVDDSAMTIDFEVGAAPAEVVVNGRRFDAAGVGALAELLTIDVAERGRQPLSLPFSAVAEGQRLCLGFAPVLTELDGDLSLVGASAERAVARAADVTGRRSAWGSTTTLTDPRPQLDALNAGWGGPLIISMPRTGSTLFGSLLLLAADPPGSKSSTFARYLHEPIAPVFWQGRGLEATAEIVAPQLTARDIVQESAYQLTTSEIAQWFVEHARPPVVFLVRHPQRAWPSRWRVMLRMMRSDEERRTDWARIDAALEDSDFSGVGDLLTGRVRPADNGWGAFLAAVRLCRDAGIDHVIVDNTRFRDHPEATLREVTRRWGVPFDERMTTWQTLEDVQDRVVMGDMARNAEYEWYYARTLGSRHGIIRADDALLEPDRFPTELRGESTRDLTIDEAATWYRAVLTRPEVLR